MNRNEFARRRKTLMRMVGEHERVQLSYDDSENISYADVVELIGAENAAALRDLSLRLYSEAAAYAEFVFTERAWPEFGARELARAVEEFRKRDRRFGSIASSA